LIQALKELYPEYVEHFFDDDQRENDDAQQDDQVHPRPPTGPGREGAGQLDDHQEADQAQHEEVLVAEAAEDSQDRQREEGPGTEDDDDTLAFREQRLHPNQLD
jgi:hypothetical protein